MKTRKEIEKMMDERDRLKAIYEGIGNRRSTKGKEAYAAYAHAATETQLAKDLYQASPLYMCE